MDRETPHSWARPEAVQSCAISLCIGERVHRYRTGKAGKKPFLLLVHTQCLTAKDLHQDQLHEAPDNELAARPGL